MKKLLLTSLSALLAFGTSSLALAAKLDLKPGLWEVTMKIKSAELSSMRAKSAKAFAELPAEERKRAEAAMASQGGADGWMNQTVTPCYTNEDLKKAEALTNDPEGNCQSKISEQTSKRIKISFKCRDGTAGNGEWNLKSSSAYDGFMQMDRKEGGPMTIKYAAKFLKADCGDTKPGSAKR